MIADERLTGHARARQGRFGGLVIEVEVEIAGRKAWRDATWADLDAVPCHLLLNRAALASLSR